MHDIDFKTIHNVLANLVMESVIFPYSKEIFLILLFPWKLICILPFLSPSCLKKGYMNNSTNDTLRSSFINCVLFVLKIFPKLHIRQLSSLMAS